MINNDTHFVLQYSRLVHDENVCRRQIKSSSNVHIFHDWVENIGKMLVTSISPFSYHSFQLAYYLSMPLNPGWVFTNCCLEFSLSYSPDFSIFISIGM